MTWLAWLGLAVLITAVAAVTGIKPKGTRHVASTRLMRLDQMFDDGHPPSVTAYEWFLREIDI